MAKSIIYALSLKQPWAALLAYGRKTIEVRSWPTTKRGRILIHAARVSDSRAEAWKHIPKELDLAARQVGGIIGAADLTSCIRYRSQAAFNKDQPLHLNEPEWFAANLYGFMFANAVVLPFRRYSGWMRFFPVEEEASIEKGRSS
jgi:hypothetical protein